MHWSGHPPNNIVEYFLVIRIEIQNKIEVKKNIEKQEIEYAHPNLVAGAEDQAS